MIFTLLLTGLLGTVALLFSIVPTLPQMPSAITSGGTWLIDQIGGFVGLLRALYGTELLAAIILITIAIFAFEPIYHSIMWVLKKIPVLNIK